jgi:hypothetical protein
VGLLRAGSSRRSLQTRLCELGGQLDVAVLKAEAPWSTATSGNGPCPGGRNTAAICSLVTTPPAPLISIQCAPGTSTPGGAVVSTTVKADGPGRWGS